MGEWRRSEVLEGLRRVDSGGDINLVQISRMGFCMYVCMNEYR